MNQQQKNPVYRVGGVLFSLIILLLGCYWFIDLLLGMDLNTFGVSFYVGAAMVPLLFMLLGGYGARYYYIKY